MKRRNKLYGENGGGASSLKSESGGGNQRIANKAKSACEIANGVKAAASAESEMAHMAEESLKAPANESICESLANISYQKWRNTNENII